MELKKVHPWKIDYQEFDVNRILINLEILEKGPISLMDIINKSKKEK